MSISKRVALLSMAALAVSLGGFASCRANECLRVSDCNPGLTCVDGTCVDAGDAAHPDGGVLADAADAAHDAAHDASSLDAKAKDADLRDALPGRDGGVDGEALLHDGAARDGMAEDGSKDASGDRITTKDAETDAAHD